MKPVPPVTTTCMRRFLYHALLMTSRWIVLCVLGLASCKPTSVADAENKGNVEWLAENGSPEAVAALGRLADKDTKAANWMESHAGMDPGVYIAAWEATERGAAWGPSTLKS